MRGMRQDVAEYLHQLYPRRTTSSPSTIAATRRRRARRRPGADRRRAAGLRPRGRPGSKPARTIAVGFSIGSGVAASLAGERQARRTDPGDAVQFAEGGRRSRCTRGCRSGRCSGTKSMPRARSSGATPGCDHRRRARRDRPGRAHRSAQAARPAPGLRPHDRRRRPQRHLFAARVRPRCTRRSPPCAASSKWRLPNSDHPGTRPPIASGGSCEALASHPYS